MTWETIKTQTLTRDMLLALANSEIGAVRVPNFLSPEVCNLAVQGIQAHGIDYYENVFPRIGRIGTTQFEHRFSPEKKKEYFVKAVTAHATRKDIFKDTGDLLSKVVDYVGDAWGRKTGLAIEDDT